MKRAIIILHPGFEEMEAIAPIDLLSRAEVDVCIVGITAKKLVRGRSGVELQATHSLAELTEENCYDAVILPGGPGIKDLRKHPQICELLKQHHAAGKAVACICAAPLLLLDSGILPASYTAHPSTSAELPGALEQDCVWDDGILTSRGAGTATQFGLSLVEALTDETTRTRIAESICWS